MNRKVKPEDLVPTPITVTLEAAIIRTLKDMEKHTKQPVDVIVTKALKMFIATHSDYLGRGK